MHILFLARRSEALTAAPMKEGGAFKCSSLGVYAEKEEHPDSRRPSFILRFLQVLFVGLDHLLDHLATDRAGFAAGQVAVVTLLEVDTNLP